VQSHGTLKKKKKAIDFASAAIAKIVGYNFTTPNWSSINTVISTCWYHKWQQNANS
jgi:hypothetical protein